MFRMYFMYNTWKPSICSIRFAASKSQRRTFVLFFAEHCYKLYRHISVIGIGLVLGRKGSGGKKELHFSIVVPILLFIKENRSARGHALVASCPRRGQERHPESQAALCPRVVSRIGDPGMRIFQLCERRTVSSPLLSPSPPPRTLTP